MPQAKPCEKCGRDYYPLRRGYCHRCDMQRRARYGYQCSFVDAAPVRQHVAALGAAGIGLRRLAQLSGVSRSALTCLVNGRSERGSGPNKRVSAATAQAILAIEVRMSRVPWNFGGGPVSIRLRSPDHCALRVRHFRRSRVRGQPVVLAGAGGR